MKLFLDDERFPQDVTWVPISHDIDWTIVRTYKTFTEAIEDYFYHTKELPEFVSFDHDLADFHYQVMIEENRYLAENPEPDGIGSLPLTFDYGREKTGFDCAKWLVEFCIDHEVKFPNHIVHSMNPIGKKRIDDYIAWAKTKFDFL